MQMMPSQAVYIKREKMRKIMKVQVAEPMKDPYRFMMAGGKIRAIYP